MFLFVTFDVLSADERVFGSDENERERNRQNDYDRQREWLSKIEKWKINIRMKHIHLCTTSYKCTWNEHIVPIYKLHATENMQLQSKMHNKIQYYVYLTFLASLLFFTFFSFGIWLHVVMSFVFITQSYTKKNSTWKCHAKRKLNIFLPYALFAPLPALKITKV